VLFVVQILQNTYFNKIIAVSKSEIKDHILSAKWAAIQPNPTVEQ